MLIHWKDSEYIRFDFAHSHANPSTRIKNRVIWQKWQNKTHWAFHLFFRKLNKPKKISSMYPPSSPISLRKSTDTQSILFTCSYLILLKEIIHVTHYVNYHYYYYITLHLLLFSLVHHDQTPVEIQGDRLHSLTDPSLDLALPVTSLSNCGINYRILSLNFFMSDKMRLTPPNLKGC